MSNILIVLPFSGRGFGGGLAVFNQELTKALKQLGHEVRLLTMKFSVDKLNPTPADHGEVELLFIDNPQVRAMGDCSGASGDKDRNTLYDLFNSEAFILQPDVQKLIQGADGKWAPDIIIGHSRFSGPAAIVLKKRFPAAKAVYFMHSFPVEGSVLTGYEAYGEKISPADAKQKFQKEMDSMPQADLVVAVGPLIRNGVKLILEQAGKSVCVHECIGGVKLAEAPAIYPGGAMTRMLFMGRVSEPIKGLDAVILAATSLKSMPISITVRYWDDKTFGQAVVDKDYVQNFINGALGNHATFNIQLEDKVGDAIAETLKYHCLLMPSYIEHFGLVPFEALGNGVPVLVNQISGAGMFLADQSRFGTDGLPCVVQDFKAPGPGPLKPVDYLQNVPKDAFDERPQKWAQAMYRFTQEAQQRFQQAARIYNVLKGYSWEHCARGIVTAVGMVLPPGQPTFVSVQNANGEVKKL